ncbi:hypothetical protein ACG02S_21145 [Roseateles sp. DC23W]|uniref:Uncharacterized protein n=1 Tax=Pelomonas dachongensis TaxID=3299029 RepID=A0ABW7ESW4_9BURK
MDIDRSVGLGGWDRNNYIGLTFSVENFNQIGPIGFAYRATALKARQAEKRKPSASRSPPFPQRA